MIKEDILENIRKKSVKEIADAIINGIVSLEECKQTNQFDAGVREQVEAIVKPILKEIEDYRFILSIKNDPDLCIQKCDEFIWKYANSERILEVQSLKKDFEEQLQLDVALAERGESKIAALKRFKEKNPNSKLLRRVEIILEQETHKLESEKEKLINDIRNGNYNKDEILDMLENGKISENALVPKYISRTGLNHYKRGEDIVFEANPDLGPIRPMSTDVFFIGVPDAGKSCLLAGLLLYTERYYEKFVDIKVSNPSGKKYADNLLHYASQGLVPGSTLDDENSINYIAVDIQNEKHSNRVHPINFIEMSGEHITRTYENIVGGDVKIESIPFHQYLKSDNDKYFFIVVDYKKTNVESRQNQYLQTLLSYFKQFKEHGILERTKAINLILTKSDLLDGGTHDVQLASDFITKRGSPYNNLFEGLKDLYKANPFMGQGKRSSMFERRKRNDQMEPKIYPFSLGKFHLFDVSFTYDEDPSQTLFRDIINNSLSIERKNVG